MKPIEISYTMTDPDLYAMVMHSKSKLFGLTGSARVKIFMIVIALGFMMLAVGLPSLVGMTADDVGKVPFQIGLLGGGAILVALYPTYAKWYTRRASAAYQTLPLPIRLVIDDTGINAQLDGQSGSTSWKLIERAVETDSHIFLYLNRLRGYIIPKSAIEDEGSLKRLRALAVAHVADAALMR